MRSVRHRPVALRAIQVLAVRGRGRALGPRGVRVDLDRRHHRELEVAAAAVRRARLLVQGVAAVTARLLRLPLLARHVAPFDVLAAAARGVVLARALRLRRDLLALVVDVLTRADLLHNVHGLLRVLALGADARAVAVEQEGEGHAGEGEEGRHAGGPVHAEVVEHLGGEEREGGAEEAAQDRVGREHRGRVHGVAVDEVVKAAEEDEDHAGAEGRAGDDGHDPVDLGPVGPREPEQAHRQQHRADQRGRQARLGRRVVQALGLGGGVGARVAPVVRDDVREREHEADGDADEGQAADALAPAAPALEDDGEGREAQVQRPVHDGHVNGDDGDDGLADEEDPGAGQRRLQRLRDRGLLTAALLQHRDVLPAGEFRQLGGAVAQDDGRVGLGHDEGGDDPHDAGEEGHDPLQPAPADGLRDEAADDGAELCTSISFRFLSQRDLGRGNDFKRIMMGKLLLRRLIREMRYSTYHWAHKRRDRKYSQRQPSLLCREHIRDDAARIRERTAAERAGPEAQDQERLDIVRAAGAGQEGRQRRVRGEEQGLAAVQLAQGPPEQGPDGEAEHEERDAERDHLLAGAELLEHLDDAARVGRAVEGDGQRGHAHEEGQRPALGAREEHGVARVVRQELDHVRVGRGAGAGVAVVQHVRRDERVRGDEAEVRRPGGMRGAGGRRARRPRRLGHGVGGGVGGGSHEGGCGTDKGKRGDGVKAVVEARSDGRLVAVGARDDAVHR